MSLIRVMIADDHALVREGLRQLLKTQSDIEVVGEAGNGIEALELARQLRPDVLLLDIAMPRMSGLETVRLMHSASPETRIVVLSMYETESYAQQMLQAGAFGYVLKCEPSSDMLSAIRAAYARRFFFSNKIHQSVVNGYLEGKPPKVSRVKAFDSLSEREKQVFFLIIEGNSSAQIGEVLCLSIKTIEKHRASICKKLGVTTPVEMVKYAIRGDLVDPDFWKS